MVHKIFRIFKNYLDRLIPILPPFIKIPLRFLYRTWRKVLTYRIVQRQQAAFAQVLAENSASGRAVILFAPSLDWSTQLFQRPQQMAIALARSGALVFYPQPQPSFRKPPFEKLEEGLYLCNVLVDAFYKMEKPLIYVLTWNSGQVKGFTSPRVIYDFVDDVNVFYGNLDEIKAGHRYLVENAEIIMATAAKLFAEVSEARKDTLFSPNGVDFGHFQPRRGDAGLAVPEDMAPILAEGKPVVGYYGALARWFDYELLVRLCALRPNYSFVLIGPDYDGTLKPKQLLGAPNVHWLGVKAYQDLPAYLACFDVATIPFLVNDITHATSPLKLFEYMAGGKPVVVTPMQESMRYPGVLVGDGAEDFAQKLDEAMALRSDAAYLETIRGVALQNTWESRAAALLEHISPRKG